jgi:hypothetical protein
MSEQDHTVAERDPSWFDKVVVPALVAVVSGALAKAATEISLTVVLLLAAMVGIGAGLIARRLRAAARARRAVETAVRDQRERIEALESEVQRLTRLTYPGWLQPLIVESQRQEFIVHCEPGQVLFTAPDGRAVVAHTAGVNNDFAQGLEYRRVLEALESLGYENPWQVPARRVVALRPD